MPKLGDRAQDKVTGFTGIVTAHVKYLTGCDEYRLESDDTEAPHELWVDVFRLRVVERQVVAKPQEVPSAG